MTLDCIYVNPFEFLGLEPDATEQEIKSAYRQRLKHLHPDKNVGAPDNIAVQLAGFTQQLNDVYKDLISNLDNYRRQYARREQTKTKKVVNKPNPFNLPVPTLTRIGETNISTVKLNQLCKELKFPSFNSNLVLTAIRMRSLALKDSSLSETYSFQFAMMFILGARISQVIFGEKLGESSDVLDLKTSETSGYIQGAIDDAEYFMNKSDADLQKFTKTLPPNIGTWIAGETRRLSSGVAATEAMLQRFIFSGMVFILFQV